MIERRRDPVQGPVTLDYFQDRLSEGWKLAAVEWEKETSDEESSGQPLAGTEDPPYGLEIASDARHLQPNQSEIAVLLTVLEMTVLEKRITSIADELNRRGLRTRSGTYWTPAAVFNLLPRLVEIGPSLLRSAEWTARRSVPTLS